MIDRIKAEDFLRKEYGNSAKTLRLISDFLDEFIGFKQVTNKELLDGLFGFFMQHYESTNKVMCDNCKEQFPVKRAKILCPKCGDAHV